MCVCAYGWRIGGGGGLISINEDRKLSLTTIQLLLLGLVEVWGKDLQENGECFI